MISKSRPRLRKLRRVFILLLIIYAAWLGLLYIGQDRMLFMPTLARALPDSEAPAGLRRLWLDTPGGRVEAWLRLPAQPGPAPLAVVFHGNAETIDTAQDLAESWLDRGYAVLMPEYRGYGRSAGAPSQAAIAADAEAFLAQAVAFPEIDATRAVYHGRSLGAAVAAQLALRRKPRGLVLQSTFTSVASFAARYGAPPFLVRNPFRTDRALAGLAIPVLILHGGEDTIIPASHARALAKIGSPRTLIELRGNHNDFPLDEDAYREAVDEWLRDFGLGR